MVRPRGSKVTYGEGGKVVVVTPAQMLAKGDIKESDLVYRKQTVMGQEKYIPELKKDHPGGKNIVSKKPESESLAGSVEYPKRKEDTVFLEWVGENERRYFKKEESNPVDGAGRKRLVEEGFLTVTPRMEGTQFIYKPTEKGKKLLAELDRQRQIENAKTQKARKRMDNRDRAQGNLLKASENKTLNKRVKVFDTETKRNGMTKSAEFVIATEDGAQRKQGFVKGQLGVHKEGGKFVVTHLPTGKQIHQFSSGARVEDSTRKQMSTHLRILDKMGDLSDPKVIDQNKETIRTAFFGLGRVK